MSENFSIKLYPHRAKASVPFAFAWCGLLGLHPYIPSKKFRFRFCSNGSRSLSVDDTKSINIFRFRFRSICFDP